MKTLIKTVLSAAAAFLWSCSGDAYYVEMDVDTTSGDEVAHEMIELGKKLEDPYSLSNMTKAVANLYQTKADRVALTATDVYVRFLPKTEDEYEKLVDEGLILVDHPLDYQIVKDGDYYHDPSVPEEEITWQYAVVSKGSPLPQGIESEVLDDCYIPENDVATRAGWIDWDAVEREAFRITGNSDLLLPETRAGGLKPEGRITIVDSQANGGKPFGVAGVKVMCNSFVKYSSAYTDRDGYYKIKKGYSGKVRYRLVFENEKGFSIGLNLILVSGSTSAMGKASAEGMDFNITSSSDKKLFTRCAVNNAAYDYMTRCAEDDMDISLPPKDLRIWIFQKLNASSAVMMHHGAAFDDLSLVTKFLGAYAPLVKIFLPDITLGVQKDTTYAGIYGLTCHELAHSSHYSKVGNSYWNKYIYYILSSFLESNGTTYGNGTGAGAGHCAVGEMWGYFIQNSMYNDRYGGAMPSWGLSYWFHPQIFLYLSDRELSKSKIFKALGPDVTDVPTLKSKLISLYPEQKTVIEQVFDRYSD